MKTFRELEKMTKGVSNHRRIEILNLLARKSKLSVIQISIELKVNFKTIAEHVRKLALAGLVAKKNKGQAVQHTVTHLGRLFLRFLSQL